jgi:hypothetical protein
MTAEAVAKALGGRKAGAAWMCGADGAPPHSGPLVLDRISWVPAPVKVWPA